jgi:hypothetical protein
VREQSGIKVNLELDINDARRILRVIGQRQHDCRKVTPQFPMYEKYRFYDNNLEAIKMEIANQLPKASELGL